MPDSFNREAVIHELYVSKEIAAYLRKMNPEALREDLKQEVFIVLCGMDTDRLQSLHNAGMLVNYTIGCMSRMIMSGRSSFYNTYRKPTEGMTVLELQPNGELKYGATCSGDAEQPDFVNRRVLPQGLVVGMLPDTDNWEERIEHVVSQLDPYEAGMIRLYAEMGQTCKPIAKATGISERGVRFAIAKAKSNAKTLLKQ